jgi:hypothetical protein
MTNVTLGTELTILTLQEKNRRYNAHKSHIILEKKIGSESQFSLYHISVAKALTMRSAKGFAAALTILTLPHK